MMNELLKNLLVASTDLKYGEKSIHVSLLYNPSHLEAVNPVSMGKTRAKQMIAKDGDYGENSLWGDKVLNIQVNMNAVFQKDIFLFSVIQ